MQVIKEEGSRPIKAWVGTKPVYGFSDEGVVGQVPDIEDSALVQLKNLARLPFIASNGVAVMPDVHAGIGSTVGTVIATDRAIIPAAVGVDIGCGMVAVRTSLRASDLPDSLVILRAQIERDVPAGNAQYQREQDIQANWQGRHELTAEYLQLKEAFPGIKSDVVKVDRQLGTLGNGNHFIELCVEQGAKTSAGDDMDPPVWIMLHSGSRGVGNAIGRYFINLAKETCERWHINLPHQDLAYFPEGTDLFDDYTRAVGWAQNYAFQNRAVMLERVVAAMRRIIPLPFTLTAEAINCHHNYVERENHFGRNLWVTRKGAIRARKGDLGIIPGSMGQRSYIVCGKGHLESYCSCSHGAGRVMSRTEAGKRFSLADLVAQTEGVECRKDEGVIDEIPGAYKDIDTVMANQADLVEVRHTLKQVLCVKG